MKPAVRARGPVVRLHFPDSRIGASLKLFGGVLTIRFPRDFPDSRIGASLKLDVG